MNYTFYLYMYRHPFLSVLNNVFVYNVTIIDIVYR